MAFVTVIYFVSPRKNAITRDRSNCPITVGRRLRDEQGTLNVVWSIYEYWLMRSFLLFLTWCNTLQWATTFSLSRLYSHIEIHHTCWDYSGQVISLMQTPVRVPDNTQHPQETGNRALSSSMRAAADPNALDCTGTGIDTMHSYLEQFYLKYKLNTWKSEVQLIFTYSGRALQKVWAFNFSFRMSNKLINWYLMLLG